MENVMFDLIVLSVECQKWQDELGLALLQNDKLARGA